MTRFRLFLLVGVISIIILVLFNSEDEKNIQEQQESEVVSEMENSPKKNGDSQEEDFSYQVEPGITVELNKSEGNRLAYNYIITNNSEKKLELFFNTSQTVDYQIMNEEGLLVFDYARGKSFMQVTKEEVIEPGESFRKVITIPPLDPGSYSLEVRLAATNAQKYEAKVEFQLD